MHRNISACLALNLLLCSSYRMPALKNSPSERTPVGGAHSHLVRYNKYGN